MNDYLRMRSRRVLVAGLLVLCSLSAMAQLQYANGARKGMVKVKFTSSMTTSLSQLPVSARSKQLSTGIAAFDATAKSTKATNMYRLFPFDVRYENKLRKHGLHLWYVIEIDESIDPKTAVAQFKQLKEVAIAEVDREKTLSPYSVKPYAPTARTLEAMPFNDPLLKDQWHYNNTGQTGYADADINLFEAWTKTTGATNVIVSVHDEGADVSHEDLKANIWTNTLELNGQAGVDDDGNGYIDDINGYNFDKRKGAIDAQYHGTHVAGTIAAVNNNGKGVSGVAGGNGSGNGVKIMSLQVMGGGSIEKSYVYAANNGAVISQNSWGYSNPGGYEQSVLDAIAYFVEEAGDYQGSPMKGGLVIFAAGNSNYDGEWYPGYYEKTLSVAALGPEWKKASYSNFGAWVEVSAPGGDTEYGNKNGVLSTIPNNQYAYLQGTSMACPHVSGVAALALANRNKQLTNTELWNKLITGVVSIDEHNEDYLGKLGSGAIDAALVIQNDLGIAPLAISNLAITGVAQEFATLTWTVPTDEDDGKPTAFNLYYNTQAITNGNLLSATKITIKNTAAAGTPFTYEVANLLGLTSYHFVVTSVDRWGNEAVLSNAATATTNAGPAIAVDANSQSIDLTIDVTTGTTASHEMTILNGAEGILRWNHFMRHTNTALSYNAASLQYPVASSRKGSGIVRKQNVTQPASLLKSNEASTTAFTTIEKPLAYWATNIIGETDISLTNSAAARFVVTETEGFNLTQARMYLKHDPAKGPVIVEVYKGTTATKANLIYAQEHNNYGTDEANAYITLNEQLYFEQGSTFWLVFHVPAGNLFPLGIGFEIEPSYSDDCFISFNVGNTWQPLADALGSEDFAWTVTAASYNAHLGTYLTLEPGSGDIAGNEEAQTTLTAQAAVLANGNYSANLIITSNDANQRELRVPVNMTVSGHMPNIKHIDIADYGSVFVGEEKTLEFVLDNQGYGNFNDPVFDSNSADFEIDGSAPWQIKAREQVVLKVKFKPSAPGNRNGLLTFTNGYQTHQISLFGVGSETAQLVLTPEIQTINNIAIGDVVNAQVTVENTGAYPLKYFVPGFDEKGVSENWPSDYHSYGYKVRSNYASESNPISYSFQDISTTGTNITDYLLDSYTYHEVDLGFEFPYYGQNQTKIYIAQKGFTVFDNSVNPVNTPQFPGNDFSPKGIITPIGGFYSYLVSGDIFYQVEADRIIIQYHNVWDGYNVGETITAQMVLYANGDIRFFYDSVNMSEWTLNSLSIFIEDLAQQDGILISEWDSPADIYSGLALGFDYPGPNIITSVTNGSGILAPGASAVVDVELNTSTLVEGTINRYINFISNVPASPESYALIELEVTSGGVTLPVVSLDTIDFGNVFQGAIKAKGFTIKNPGTANVDISSIAFVNDDFTFTGDEPTTIKPGLYKNYTIQVPTGTLATLEDWLSINYADGTHDTVYVKAIVVNAPAISVDLSTLQKTLAYGETATEPFTIENTGLANLEVAAVGSQWLSFTTSTLPSSTVQDFGYVVEKHNNGDYYQWIDIRKTGEQLPFVDYQDYLGTFWRELTLPFPIEFYGQTYNSFKIGDNGLISFEDEPEGSFFTDNIPTATHPGACIMPYWTFSSFSDYIYPLEDIGIFYQAFDDKFIITWSYFTNNFGGMGDPVSAQVIFYKDGVMKFQYKAEEGGADLTSQATSIGLQRNSSEGISISAYQPLIHEQGLAYIIVPTKRYTIAPGSTLVGDIRVDATNIYGGQYNQSLKIQTNVPNQESLEKPVELTVTGDATLVTPDSIKFGKKLVAFDGWSPTMYTVDLELENDGAAPLEITYGAMADGSALGLMMLADGWFGPEWTLISNIWSPWAWETPTYTIKPGDKLSVRAAFFPSMEGDYADEVIFTTNIGEKRFVLTGVGYEPAAISVDTTPIELTMNTTSETATETITFDNVIGKSDLEYSLSIDFGRATSASASPEKMATSINYTTAPSAETASVSTAARTTATYNRTIRHSDRETPDTFVGTGGSAPFTLATRFNAGAEGFNMSHVETWFRTESLTTVVVNVEVRAGGSDISSASILAEGSLEITGSGDDGNGDWHSIALDNAAGIYPNEDFYVVVTYPLGIELPQGTLTDEATVAGRYYYFSEGSWFNVQEVGGFATAGWLLYAAEETAGEFTWLKITSDVTGTVAMGDASEVSLTIDGALASRGDQVAHVVFTSNDPANPSVRVPVSLHMNEAPAFMNAPTSVVLAENETETLEIPVVDSEGNNFTVVPAQTYSGLTHTFVNGVLSIVLAPAFGDEGTYAYTFRATDEHNAVSEMTVSLEVLHTNQAPAYIGAADAFTYHKPSNLVEYEVADYFADPDADDFTYTVSSSNDAIATVFASATKFIVKTQGIGEVTLTFTLTDSNGATKEEAITVTVDMISGLEDKDVNFSLYAYPNPTTGKIRVHVSGEIHKQYNIAVMNVLGASMLTKENVSSYDEAEVDLSALPKGIYLIEVSDKAGKSVRRIVKE